MKKQIYSAIAVSVVLLLMSSIFNSCIQEVIFAKATVETSQVTSVTEATAISGGVVTSDGGSNISVRGVCWNTSPYPTIENDTTIEVVGTGPFTSLIKGLSPSTTYYVRAYAINKGGTSYGNEVTFTTQSGVVDLVTAATSAITPYTATSGGTISSDGDAAVTARGVCWNTSSAPTIDNLKTANGSGSGTFTSNITGLIPGNTYYVRSYAINSVGTSYGNELSFTSSGTVTDIDGNVYSSVKIGSQTWMVENLKTTKYNDGTSIPNITDSSAWCDLSTPGYCFYNNDAANKSIYGALYNWYTVNTGNLAPTGWHVPTDAEWTTLENYLIANGYNYDGTTTGNKIAKSLAATTGWHSYSGTGTIGDDLTKNNTSGFAGLPGGYRSGRDTFYGVGYDGYWWSSMEDDSISAWSRNLYFGGSYVYSDNKYKQFGFSVRCVRDY